MKIKVCGNTREEDIRLAAELGAWAVGLVLIPGSPRALDLMAAQRLRREVPSGVLAVGVFRDAPRAQVLDAVRSLSLDVVQFHGRETPQDCLGYPIPVYKAFSLGPGETPAIDGYEVAGILVEPSRSDEDRRLGRAPASEARREAWETASRLKGSAPMLILAGGLVPENVAEAAGLARPDAVDVSGGVESKMGTKDPEKLRRFFEALKGL